MKKIWWTWDIRMRWHYGFSQTSDSFLKNYSEAINAAGKYGIEGIVIWGFLRDSHGGIDTAKELVKYANSKRIKIIPGFGIDGYGGAYYQGESYYSLDNYLENHKEGEAINKDGTALMHCWPPSDSSSRMVCCPNYEPAMNYYLESVEWLLKEFKLGGIQFEQGDVGLCQCSKCKKQYEARAASASNFDVTNATRRMVPVIEHALKLQPSLLVITETYCGLLPETIIKIEDNILQFPQKVYMSWQAYSSFLEPAFQISEDSKSPTPHGCIAIRTNNDLALGERNDVDAVRNAICLAHKAGLDMSYIYGEYPDIWPLTARIYQAWAEECNSYKPES